VGKVLGCFLFSFFKTFALKKALFAFLLCWLGGNAMACEMCGCGGGSGAWSMLPQYDRNLVGFRFSYRSSNTQHPSSLLLPEVALYSHEWFATTDLWARYFVKKRVQLLAQLPYVVSGYKAPKQSTYTYQSGLGDASLVALYALANNADSMGNKKFALWLGGGVKAPTGSFDHHKVDDPDWVSATNPNLMPGSGSWDGIAQGNLVWRQGKWGTTADVQYRICTRNPVDVQLGNKAQLSMKGFYWWRPRVSRSFVPSAGLLLERADKDRFGTISVLNSGGQAVSAMCGFDAYFRKASVGISAAIPVSQTWGNGKIETYCRVNLFVALNIN